MKKLFKQILKALGYFAVYLAVNNLASLVISSVLGYMTGRECAMAGISQEEGMAVFQERMNSMTGICLMVGALLTLLVYFVIEKIKKTGLAKETDMKKVSGKCLGLTVIGALGGMFLFNFILNILPIPAGLMGNLTSGMSKLTAYPFWQAVLANVLLVPVLEEVVYRGYLFSRLEKAMPPVAAALISSAVFGICHGGVLWAIWAFVLGMAICVVRIRSGSIIPGMIFHIIMNGFAMIVSYFNILENMTTTVMYVLTAAGGILLMVYIVGMLMDKGAGRVKNNTEVLVTSSKE